MIPPLPEDRGIATDTGGGGGGWGSDWTSVRALWQLDDGILHLNHGSFGAVPVPVLDAQARWRDRVERNPTRFFERELAPLLDGVRARIADFVGADPAGLLLVPNVTTGIAAVLASTPLAAGDEVLVTDHTYIGARAAVDAACAQAGATVRAVELALDSLADPAAVQAALCAAVSGRTRLAVVDHITSPTGAILAIGPLVAALRARGVVVAVDGAHAPGAVALDVSDVDADYYVGTLHKWCCAPRGAAFLAIAPARRGRVRAAVVGSRAAEGFPAGLEWWGTADHSALLSAPAALDLLEGLGANRVREHNHRLAAQAQVILAEALGTEPPRLAHASMALVLLPPRVVTTPADAGALRILVADRLRAEVVITSQRGRGCLRLSAHLYNRRGDYEQLAAGLPELLRALG